MFEVATKFWINAQDTPFLGAGRIDLLERIDRTGSMAAAAKEMGMSYKAAWDMIDQMNNIAPKPLVERVTGGKGGGGTRLTEKGHEAIRVYRAFEERLTALLREVGGRDDLMGQLTLLRRLTMKTSARNQWHGEVTALSRGAVNSEVVLRLSGGESLTAVVTNEAAEELELALGRQAYALVKAGWVVLAKEPLGPISIRNRLKGQIIRIVPGAVNSEVILKLSGGTTVVAVVTTEGLEELELKEGDEAIALIKASHVIIGV